MHNRFCLNSLFITSLSFDSSLLYTNLLNPDLLFSIEKSVIKLATYEKQIKYLLVAELMLTLNCYTKMGEISLSVCDTITIVLLQPQV